MTGAPEAADDLVDDPRVLEVAREYAAALEAGLRPERSRFTARCPERADALEECLDGIELAHALRDTEPAVEPDPPAERLGDFRIVREIGRGGMGVVYEAIQTSLGRKVALKVLPTAAAADPRRLRRFAAEAHAAAQLQHPRIVPIYAVGAEEGVHYFAMRLIEGRALDAVIEDARTASRAPTGEDFRLAARRAADVADALEFAHEAGVVHRDVKPANLLLDQSGEIFVADFGLAQAAGSDLTATGQLVGTLRYMSPEQAAGSRRTTDGRSDIYSLGATLYESLCLRPMFDAEDRQALLHDILNVEPRPPRAVTPAIPRDLETIVLKAVAKAPADRYATAAEFAADLRRFLAGIPPAARRPGPLERGLKLVRRRPGAAAAVLCVLGLGFAGAMFSVARLDDQRRLTAQALQKATERAAVAEQRFVLARQAADEMIALAEEELAVDAQFDRSRRRLLTSALAYYDRLIASADDASEAETALEPVRERVTAILNDLGAVEGDKLAVLLAESSVLDDLGASPRRRAEIVEFCAATDARRREIARSFNRLNSEQRLQRIVESAREANAGLLRLLSKDEIARLRQIALQCSGPAALREPEVAAKLDLTVEQRDKIRKLALDVAFEAAARNRGGPPRPEFGDRDGDHGGFEGGPERGGPPRGDGGGERDPRMDAGPERGGRGMRPRGGGRGGPGGPGGPGTRNRAGLRDLRPELERALQWLDPAQLAAWREISGPPFRGTLSFFESSAATRPAPADTRPTETSPR